MLAHVDFTIHIGIQHYVYCPLCPILKIKPGQTGALGAAVLNCMMRDGL